MDASFKTTVWIIKKNYSIPMKIIMTWILVCFITSNNFAQPYIKPLEVISFEKKIKIDSIEKSQSEIRLFFLPSFGGLRRLVRIYKKNKIWRGLKYIDFYNSKNTQTSKLISRKRVASVIDSLLKEDLLTLPNLRKIDHRKYEPPVIMDNGDTTYIRTIVSDGIRFFLEVKIGTEIKSYYFANIEIYADSYPNTPQYKPYLRIINLITQKLK